APIGSPLSGIIITGLHFRCAPERPAEAVPRQVYYTLDLPPLTNHFPIIVNGYQWKMIPAEFSEATSSRIVPPVLPQTTPGRHQHYPEAEMIHLKQQETLPRVRQPLS
ncbi:MAG TPA: hypothetical protein VLR45_04090, partial [Desulfoprunum sp.]|nr:hypothetical protein [Desulfoprunum sp.]